MDAEEFKKEKGYWAGHPDWPAEDWQAEVANGDTRRGYWDWVQAGMDQAREG